MWNPWKRLFFNGLRVEAASSAWKANVFNGLRKANVFNGLRWLRERWRTLALRRFSLWRSLSSWLLALASRAIKSCA